MVQQITRMSVQQTAKVLGVLYFVVGLLIIPIFILSRISNPGGEGMHLGLLVLLPVLYGALGYIFGALGCLIYNAVASQIGGIEFTLGPAAGTSTGRHSDAGPAA